jgi:hypothetical protein
MRIHRAGGSTQVVECLPSKSKDWSSTTRTAKGKKKFSPTFQYPKQFTKLTIFF